MIRRRIVIAVTGVAALAIFLAGTLVLVMLEDRLVANLDRRFRDGTLTAEVRDTLRNDGPLRSFDDRLEPNRTVAVVAYSRDGRVRSAFPSGPSSAPDPLPDGSQVRADGSLVTVSAVDDSLRYRATALTGAGNSRIVVATSMSTVDETLDDARRILRGSGLAAVVLIGLASWLLVRRSLSPIEGMIGTADRIAGGDLTHRTGVADDGTEVGRLGTALDTMLDRIEVAVDDKSASEARLRRFVAEASHELRTPLTSVRGYAELYRQGADDPAEVATSMARIEAEATRMSGLVENLLQLARMDREPSRPTSTVVDVRHLAGVAVDAVRVVDATRTYELVTDATPSMTVGDAGQLRQVLDNLLTNARLHTPAGSTVVTTVRAEPAALNIQVRDDGPGIAAVDRPRIFDRFWRATRTDANPVEGTGLGLSIVETIVTSHGGRVSVSESPEGGACFDIVLPATPPPPPPPPDVSGDTT